MVRKIAVSLEAEAVAQLDRWVREGKFPNRSRAIGAALSLLQARDKRQRLARELAKLDPKEEQALAEEDLGDALWPPY